MQVFLQDLGFCFRQGRNVVMQYAVGVLQEEFDLVRFWRVGVTIATAGDSHRASAAEVGDGAEQWNAMHIGCEDQLTFSTLSILLIMKLRCDLRS